MNARSVKTLAVVVVVLFAALFALNSGDRNATTTGSDLLFPELKARLNDLNSVTITDSDGAITLQREIAEGGAGDGRWIVPERGGYPADTGNLRQLLLALADARKLEQKTSDPELYARLGVDDPKEGGDGVLVAARGDNAAVSLILGNPAQREFRYARIPEETASWLIDQNPNVPEDGAGWLSAQIVDIDASRIESVTIRHADDETIRIAKEDAGDTNFQVEDVPEGRELRYASVANGIAGVLSGLTLEDVRKAGEQAGEPAAVVDYRTFDGLEVTVSISTAAGAETDDADAVNGSTEEHWITLQAAANPAGANDQPGADPGGEASDSTGSSSGEPGESPEEPAQAAGAGSNDSNDDSADEDPGLDSAEGETPPDPASEAREINERVGGWSYRIPGYKADQLMRRWEDLLSEPPDGDSGD